MLDGIKADEFESRVLQAEKPVLIDFGAEWCHPCRRLDPVIEELAAVWGERVLVLKLDVDEQPEIAMRYQVMGVPTLILFKDGKPVARMTGFAPRRRVENTFQPHLAPVV